MPLPLSALAGSPFDTYLVPGLILFGVLGLGPLVAARLAWLRHPLAPTAALVVGAGLLIWVAVEVAIIGYSNEPPLQAIYGILGVAIVLVAVRWLLDVGLPDSTECLHAGPTPALAIARDICATRGWHGGDDLSRRSRIRASISDVAPSCSFRHGVHISRSVSRSDETSSECPSDVTTSRSCLAPHIRSRYATRALVEMGESRTPRPEPFAWDQLRACPMLFVSRSAAHRQASIRPICVSLDRASLRTYVSLIPGCTSAE